MANFDVLKNFITQRVYTNGTQAITGKVMQDTLLEMLKAWGYQFQGFATPETVPPATANDYRPYYLANAKGTYTNFGGAVLDGSTLAMLYYDGSWKSQVLSIGGGGGTGNFVTLNTEQTITAKKTFTAAPHFAPEAGSPFTVGNTTKVNSLNVDLLDGLHNGQLDAQHLTLAGDVAEMGEDFNTLRYMGVYSYGTPPFNNNPGGAASGLVFQFSNNADMVNPTNKYWVSQLAAGTDRNLYYRMKSSGTWGAWNKIAFSSDLGNYVKKAGDTMTGTLTLDTIRSSASYLTFSTRLYIGNATDTNNTVNQGSIRTIGGISASLSIWAGKNITASGEVTAISDIRTKSDIRSLTFRGACRPVSFIKDGKRGIGFIAQEVQKLYPELVVEGADGLLSLNYAGYTAVLQSQVDNHETELQRLRGRVEELERKNEELSRRLGYGK